MSIELLQKALPAVEQWITGTLARYASQAHPVASLSFARLGQFYPASLLENAKFIAVESVPKLPLTALGLPGFEDFENMEVAGITYLDTYFIRTDCLRNEALHFHELVHVIQWQHLGPQNFMLGYALGHRLSGGYHTNPFERIAYALQRYFESGNPAMDMVHWVQNTTTRYFDDLRKQAEATLG